MTLQPSPPQAVCSLVTVSPSASTQPTIAMVMFCRNGKATLRCSKRCGFVRGCHVVYNLLKRAGVFEARRKINVCTCLCVRACARARACVRAHTHTHAHKHPRTYARTHTHTHTHTHIQLHYHTSTHSHPQFRFHRWICLTGIHCLPAQDCPA